jgi:hypothetical protein
MYENLTISEIRAWIQFLFIVIGGTIGLLAYRQNIKQRRLENALKIIELFRNGLQPTDIDNWKMLLLRSSEPSGAKPGNFISVDGKEYSIGCYFCEGSPDSGAVARMAEGLEVVCYEICNGTVEPRIIWYELGQLLRNYHNWLFHIPSYTSDKSLLEESFPSIKLAFDTYHKNFDRWPHRVIEYIED